jgi:hypothetical protein
MKDQKEEVLDDKSAEVFESIDDILSTDDIEYRTLKAWGGKMARVGSLTAGQMITFLENNDKPEKKRENGLMLITLSLVRKDGTRLVNGDDADAVKQNIEKLKTKDSKTNGRIVEQVLLLNGLNRKDAQAIAKNASGEAPTDASPTGSLSS